MFDIFSFSPFTRFPNKDKRVNIWQEIENICFINWVMSCFERIIEGLVSLIFYISNLFCTSISVSMVKVKKGKKNTSFQTPPTCKTTPPHPPPPTRTPLIKFLTKQHRRWICSGSIVDKNGVSVILTKYRIANQFLFEWN